MDLRELTEAMNRFVTAKGWYEPGSPRPQTPRNLAASLAIEAAEVLEHYQWGPDVPPGPEAPSGADVISDAAGPPPGLAEELADVALYLLQLASVTGIDLEQAVLDKLERNYGRQWPGRSISAGPPGDPGGDPA